MFPKSFSSWQKCIVAQKDYFVGTGTFGSYHIQMHMCFVDRGEPELKYNIRRF
jgi:hypothetical protein